MSEIEVVDVELPDGPSVIEVVAPTSISVVEVILENSSVDVSATTEIEVVEVSGPTEVAVVEVTLEDQVVVEVEVPGFQGPPGPIGPQGPSGDAYYRHVQSAASSLWVVEHALGKYPSITVVDSGGTEVEGAVSYIDNNIIHVSFVGAFSGEAYCN